MIRSRTYSLALTPLMRAKPLSCLSAVLGMCAITWPSSFSISSCLLTRAQNFSQRHDRLVARVLCDPLADLCDREIRDAGVICYLLPLAASAMQFRNNPVKCNHFRLPHSFMALIVAVYDFSGQATSGSTFETKCGT